MWFNVPFFTAGSYDDLSILQSALLNKLDTGELIETDQAYRGEWACCSRPCNYVTDEEKWTKSKAIARHENINSRLKRLKMLMHHYHGDCKNDHVIVAIIEFDIRNEVGENYDEA